MIKYDSIGFVELEGKGQGQIQGYVAVGYGVVAFTDKGENAMLSSQQGCTEQFKASFKMFTF